MNLNKLRKQASDLMKKDKNNITMRSCWKCNSAHTHLKKSEFIIFCFECGHYFYKGYDITIAENEKKGKTK